MPPNYEDEEEDALINNLHKDLALEKKMSEEISKAGEIHKNSRSESSINTIKSK
jgi:hypothetical protein